MTAALLLLLLTRSPAPADNAANSWQGDHPPTPTLTLSGRLDIAFDTAGYPSYGYQDPFSIYSVPSGSNVLAAWFMTGLWDHASVPTHSLLLTFAGHPFGAVDAVAFDPIDGLDPESAGLGGYLVDVTSQFTGNGVYPFSALRGQPGAGLGPWRSLLWVVYEHPDRPFRTLHVNSGAESLRWAGSQAAIWSDAAGPGRLILFTQSDQVPDSYGEESIGFNGTTITCCSVFDANQGPFGSYFDLDVDVVHGTNHATVTTGQDGFGWHLAALLTPMGPVPVESSSWASIKKLYR